MRLVDVFKLAYGQRTKRHSNNLLANADCLTRPQFSRGSQYLIPALIRYIDQKRIFELLPMTVLIKIYLAT